MPPLYPLSILLPALPGEVGLVAGLLGIPFVVWLTWRSLGRAALPAAGITLAAVLGDVLLLLFLPWSGRSFGPVGGQLAVMAAPRFAVALAVGAAGLAAVLLRRRADRKAPLARATLRLLALLQLAATLAYLWGTLHEPFAVGASRVTVALPRLPAGAPIRVLHLSDLHVERWTRREARVAKLAAQLRPDLIVLTGDYLNLSYLQDPIARADTRRLLAGLRAPLGVFATLGSVEVTCDWEALFAGLGIRVLREEAAVVPLNDGRSLCLLGLDCQHQVEAEGRRLRALAAQAPPELPCLLLYHSPELMPLARQLPIDLFLCGHTHGGQVRLPLYGAVTTCSVTGKRYEMGRYIEGQTTLYVSRGLGLEGENAPRLRLLCPPEVVLVTLESGG